jgi:Zn-dependent protease
VQIQLLVKIALLVGVLIGITVHECSHAWTANKLGDPTARYLGRVTLNPLAHLDPLGTILMLYSIMIGFGIGWGKPTPVDPRYLKFGPRVGMALVAIAGPISNILTAMVFAVPLRLNLWISLPLPGYLAVFLDAIVWANLGLAIFNVLPIPPLDGFSVLLGILSQIRARWSYEASHVLNMVAAQGPLVLIGILMLSYALPIQGGILGAVMGPPLELLHRVIVGL